MSRTKNSRDLRELPNVVAAVHSPGALRCALKARPSDVDFLEIRVDNFAHDLDPLLAALPRLQVPLLVTVRHPAEGGINNLGFAQRRELYRHFLPYASLIDIELRSFEKLAGTIEEAREAGVQVIASAHYFHSTPSTANIQRLIGKAHKAGADICKVAALADTQAALGQLLGVLSRKLPLPVSVMGMGRFGKISRLLLAQAGSVLNYGYLDKPNASGQWEARTLKSRLSELIED